ARARGGGPRHPFLVSLRAWGGGALRAVFQEVCGDPPPQLWVVAELRELGTRNVVLPREQRTELGAQVGGRSGGGLHGLGRRRRRDGLRGGPEGPGKQPDERRGEDARARPHRAARDLEDRRRARRARGRPPAG